MFDVKSSFMVEKVLLMRKNQIPCCFVGWWCSIPSCQTGVWWDRCLHEFGRHVEKWNINVWRLNTFACWTCSLFSFNLQCCATLASCKENCWAKYCTDWLRSKYKWRHSNDVIVIKIPVYVPIKFLSKLIFPNFHILKLYRMIKLHHPSSSVATSNQWCWSGVRGNINKLLLIVEMCCILLLHILWSGLQVSQIGFCLTASISLWFC